MANLHRQFLPGMRDLGYVGRQFTLEELRLTVILCRSLRVRLSHAKPSARAA
jgi:hypothetical protein